jgi:hypothetical protein
MTKATRVTRGPCGRRRPFPACLAADGGARPWPSTLRPPCAWCACAPPLFLAYARLMPCASLPPLAAVAMCLPQLGRSRLCAARFAAPLHHVPLTRPSAARTVRTYLSDIPCILLTLVACLPRSRSGRQNGARRWWQGRSGGLQTARPSSWASGPTGARRRHLSCPSLSSVSVWFVVGAVCGAVLTP